MVANIRCAEIAAEQLEAFRRDPTWRGLAEEAEQDLVASFGQRAADLMDSCLEGEPRERGSGEGTAPGAEMLPVQMQDGRGAGPLTPGRPGASLITSSGVRLQGCLCIWVRCPAAPA